MCFPYAPKPHMILNAGSLMQASTVYNEDVSSLHRLIHNPDTLRADALTLPILPLVFRMPAGSFPFRRLSPLRFGLPRTLDKVLDPLPDFMVPGVLGRPAVPMFSISLLLSLSMDVYMVVVVWLTDRFSLRPGERDVFRLVRILNCHSSSSSVLSSDDR